MKFMKYFLSVLISFILTINVAIAEKWDMALAYGAGNFHSANATEFAKNVTEKSGGKSIDLFTIYFKKLVNNVLP